MERNPEKILKIIETNREKCTTGIDKAYRAKMGQFMTPASTAKLLASMYNSMEGEISLLDAGAGIGSLTVAFVLEACQREIKPTAINVTAFELEPKFTECLTDSLSLCESICSNNGIRFIAKIEKQDFIEAAAQFNNGDLFANPIKGHFTHAIVNPPYHKINSNSRHRRLLRQAGIETSNLYTAFVALIMKLLKDEGELVAITPRSFCNGVYFKPFRQQLTHSMAFSRIHVFESRGKTFKSDDVLQENIIYHAVKRAAKGEVLVSVSNNGNDKNVTKHYKRHSEIVNPHDPELFIHIPTPMDEASTAKQAQGLPCTLEDLALTVSTGRVVDFRAKEHIVSSLSKDVAPLIYACNFTDGFVVWPESKCRELHALTICEQTAKLFVPKGVYVLVKRFSAKEERRRVVAAVYDPKLIPAEVAGFENHLNYFHIKGAGLNKTFAKGLALFLNSTLVDQYLRQFNGHTQVNATDLRNIRYPEKAQLMRLGRYFYKRMPVQDRIDEIINGILFGVAGKSSKTGIKGRQS